MSDDDPGRDDLAEDPATRKAPDATTAKSSPGDAPQGTDKTAPEDKTADDKTAAPSETAEDDGTAVDRGPAGKAAPGAATVGSGSTPDAGEAAGDSPATGDAQTAGGGATAKEPSPAAADATGDEAEKAAAAPAEAPGDDDGPAEGTARKGRRRVWRRVAIGATALVAVAAIGAGWLYADLMGGIEKQDVTEEQLGTDRPKKLNKSLNILLLGSDSRDGDNARYGAAAGMAGARSDTAILLHLSPNRDQAVGISFPRDSMVHIPDCKKDKGGTVPGRFGMLNTAFAFAGPTCTWKTLEKLTGIHIDHFVQVDFAGFKRVVDALGGVEICVDRPVNDPRAELVLKAGKQTVKGEEALGYVRARYTLGNGSDLERIERQQRFMASVVNKATSGEVLTDPAKTYKFLKAVTESVTTDDDLDLSAMRKLAEGVRGMNAGQVRFVTVPVEGYAPDPNRVQWNDELAKPLFEAIRHDSELPAEQPAAPRPAVPAPKEVKVTVVDAGGKDVGRVARQLKNRGFDVEEKIEKRSEAAESRIAYHPSAEAQASALAAAVPNGVLTADAGVPAGHVTLVVGTNGVRLAPPAIDKITGGVEAGKNLCA
ncbi:LCP family protein [Actinomadura sp. NPDC047616]|uniref:LCP family protein n=1 Tax=Actinomadura sp. NPDC047616 TaxID=3155914 RepID=UPI0033E5088A